MPFGSPDFPNDLSFGPPRSLILAKPLAPSAEPLQEEPANSLHEHYIKTFLAEYCALIEKYNLMFTAVMGLQLRTVDSVLSSNEDTNDYHNYHDPILPETREALLDQIMTIRVEDH